MKMYYYSHSLIERDKLIFLGVKERIWPSDLDFFKDINRWNSDAEVSKLFIALHSSETFTKMENFV